MIIMKQYRKAESYAAGALALTVAETLQAVAEELAEAAQHLDAEALVWEIRAALDALQDTICGYQDEASDLIGGVA